MSKYTDVCYEEKDDVARQDLETREPINQADYEACLMIDEITDETGSQVGELLEEY